LTDWALSAGGLDFADVVFDGTSARIGSTAVAAVAAIAGAPCLAVDQALWISNT